MSTVLGGRAALQLMLKLAVLFTRRQICLRVTDNGMGMQAMTVPYVNQDVFQFTRDELRQMAEQS